jgi:hypothetical protein
MLWYRRATVKRVFASCDRTRSCPSAIACRCALTLRLQLAFGFERPDPQLDEHLRGSTLHRLPHPGIHRRLRVRGRSAWRRAGEHRDEEERRHTEQRRENDTSHVSMWKAAEDVNVACARCACLS